MLSGDIQDICDLLIASFLRNIADIRSLLALRPAQLINVLLNLVNRDRSPVEILKATLFRRIPMLPGIKVFGLLCCIQTFFFKCIDYILCWR
jgi:hypothetical protein